MVYVLLESDSDLKKMALHNALAGTFDLITENRQFGLCIPDDNAYEKITTGMLDKFVLKSFITAWSAGWDAAVEVRK